MQEGKHIEKLEKAKRGQQNTVNTPELMQGPQKLNCFAQLDRAMTW